jgi:hypothetical protein
MPGPVSDSYPGPSDEMPYVSSWCYRNPIVAAAEVVQAGSRPPSRLKRHAKRFLAWLKKRRGRTKWQRRGST